MEADNAYENRTNKITRKKASHREGLAIAIIKKSLKVKIPQSPYSRRGFFVTYPRAHGHARTLAREVRVLEQSSHKIRKGG
jgi:hypothetical protein